MRWVSILFCWTASVGMGCAQETRLIGAADVVQIAGLLRGELELVREKLGVAPTDWSGPMAIRKATTREAYGQALILQSRSGQLLAEQTRRLAPPQSVAVENPKPVDIYVLVKSALASVRGVKAHLGIEESPPVPPREELGAAGDDFSEIVWSNRLLRTLVRTKAGAGEVHQRINQALAYAMSIGLSSSSQRFPREGPMVPGQGEAEMLEVLRECFQVQRKIATNLNVKVAEIGREHLGPATVDDVDELSSLILSAMMSFHAEIPTKHRVLVAVFQDDRDPSHVVQRANLLRSYLDRILQLTETTSSGAN